MTARVPFVPGLELHALCERFRALEARKAEDESAANYEQALLVCEARGRLDAPVALLCEVLELSRQSLNAYANVGRRIDPALFRALVAERRPGGLPVFRWSLIVQVARLEAPAERLALIAHIRAGRWRTRDAQGYVMVQRGQAAARRARLHGAAGAGGEAAAAGDGPPPGEALAGRLVALLREAVRGAPPVRALGAVAEAAARLAAELGPVPLLASGEERAAARHALRRCAAALLRARAAIPSGGEAVEPGEPPWLADVERGARAARPTAGPPLQGRPGPAP